jgi:hypothetical protein
MLFNHPQLPPDVNPVVQKFVEIMRSGGDVSEAMSNHVFAELLRGQYKKITDNDL